MWRQGAVVGLLAIALLCGVASGQVPNGPEIQRQNQLQQLQQYELDTRENLDSSIPATQRALFDYGGYFSPQFFSTDDTNNNNHVLREYDLVGYLRADFDGVNEVFLRARAQYNDYNPGDSFDGLGSRLINPDFDRAYYKFDLQRYESLYNGTQINGDVNVELGRDLVYWGNGLAMAEVIDGAMPTFSMGNLSLAMVAGVTPVRTVDIQPDRPDFDHNTKRGFYGGMLTANVGSQHPYIYAVAQQDYNNHDELVDDAFTTEYRYNSNYLGVGSSGAISDHLHYGVEMVYESGNTLSDSSQVQGQILVPIPQVRDNIDAYAADVKLDYVPQNEHNSRFTVEGIAATGSEARGLTNTTFNGNAPGTLDRAFNAFGLLSTGLAFGAPVSNLVVVRAGASTFPFSDIASLKRLQLGGDVYLFNKADSTAPIDEPTNPGFNYLGWEPDIYLNWEVASDVTVTARYGAFIPSSKAFPSDATRQFVYGGVTFAF
jgi:hypothetical protein